MEVRIAYAKSSRDKRYLVRVARQILFYRRVAMYYLHRNILTIARV